LHILDHFLNVLPTFVSAGAKIDRITPRQRGDAAE
jgi:hypothetical protein